MTRAVPVYLAGPDVFLADALEIGVAKQQICARYGLVGRFPLDDMPSPPADLAEAIFEHCVTMMDGCAAGLVNLTPFRGVSADVGTVFEMGYLFGTAKPVFGYTSELADYAERVTPDGLLVEPFGLCDNLMLDRAAAAAGTHVLRSDDIGTAPSLAAMGAFDRAARLAAEHLGTA